MPAASPLEVQRVEQGHINPSFIVRCRGDEGEQAVFLQQVNTQVFPDADRLLRNTQRVTEHLRAKLIQAGTAEVDRRVLRLVPPAHGGLCTIDPSGNTWRALGYIDHAYSVDRPRTPEQAYAAAFAFAEFARLLDDLPPPALAQTLPDFHDTPKRFRKFLDARDRDPLNRAAAARTAVDLAASLESTAHMLSRWQQAHPWAVRTVHNDTKLNNVLFDQHTDRPLCVVDLDTVMPGLVAYDFGDLVRSCVGPAAEDQAEADGADLDLSLFRALTAGYLAGTRAWLRAEEIDSLLLGPVVVALELGLRFLTDYLEGDCYFPVRAPDQNLRRAQSQFCLVTAMARQAERMREAFERVKLDFQR
jgi:Ser/Thr protein kinase RdoA (MazF antagonist)